MSNGKNEMDIKFSELYIGQEYSKTFQVTEEKGRAFAEVSQDYNLLHLDEEYAKSTMYKGRIAHGMLVASFISGVLGNDFPGTGTVYLGQELQFVRPVRYGDEISVTVRITEMDQETGRIRLSTICKNQSGQSVIEGYAHIMKKG